MRQASPLPDDLAEGGHPAAPLRLTTIPRLPHGRMRMRTARASVFLCIASTSKQVGAAVGPSRQAREGGREACVAPPLVPHRQRLTKTQRGMAPRDPNSIGTTLRGDAAQKPEHRRNVRSPPEVCHRNRVGKGGNTTSSEQKNGPQSTCWTTSRAGSKRAPKSRYEKRGKRRTPGAGARNLCEGAAIAQSRGGMKALARRLCRFVVTACEEALSM